MKTPKTTTERRTPARIPILALAFVLVAALVGAAAAAPNVRISALTVNGTNLQTYLGATAPTPRRTARLLTHQYADRHLHLLQPGARHDRPDGAPRRRR